MVDLQRLEVEINDLGEGDIVSVPLIGKSYLLKHFPEEDNKLRESISPKKCGKKTCICQYDQDENLHGCIFFKQIKRVCKKGNYCFEGKARFFHAGAYGRSSDQYAYITIRRPKKIVEDKVYFPLRIESQKVTAVS